jgi:hypothetical protein
LLKFGKPKPATKLLPSIANKEQKKIETKKQPESKARLRWRKVVAMVINQNFFVKIVKSHGEQLKDMGVEVKKMYSDAEEEETKKTVKKNAKKLPPIKKVKSISVNEFYPTNSMNKLETIEEKSKNKLKKAPSTSMSLMHSTKFPKLKSETPSIFDNKNITQTSSIGQFPSLNNFNTNSVSSSYFKSSSIMNLDDLKEETVQSFGRIK